MSDDSNMIFGIRFRTYEQIDEFQPAGQVVAEAKTADEDRLNRFGSSRRIFSFHSKKGHGFIYMCSIIGSSA